MSSPQEFYYACKGYFDNKEDDSRVIRLQTFYILTSAGAKIRKPEQLWNLPSDNKDASPVVDMNAEQYREWYSNIKKKFNINA